MKHKKLTIGIISMVMVTAVTIISFLFFNRDASAPNTTRQPKDTLTAPKDKPVATDRVVIQNYTFSPKTITIQKGTTVIWTNVDAVAQELVFHYPNRTDRSGLLNQNANYSRSFDRPGTLLYTLSSNPDVVGSITIAP